MPLKLRAITPKHEVMVAPDKASAEIAQILGQAGWAGNMVRRMSDYPEQRSTVSGYVRTGTLGRNWRIIGPRFIRGTISVDVVNDVPYSVFVEGPSGRGARRGQRQTAEMARRGWPSVSPVAREEGERLNVKVRFVFQARNPSTRRRLR
jgi:hypothetical protein